MQLEVTGEERLKRGRGEEKRRHFLKAACAAARSCTTVSLYMAFYSSHEHGVRSIWNASYQSEMNDENF